MLYFFSNTYAGGLVSCSVKSIVRFGCCFGIFGIVVLFLIGASDSSVCLDGKSLLGFETLDVVLSPGHAHMLEVFCSTFYAIDVQSDLTTATRNCTYM